MSKWLIVWNWFMMLVSQNNDQYCSSRIIISGHLVPCIKNIFCQKSFKTRAV